MNACNLGVDSKGLHFSLKDTASLNLDADGKVLINGAMGITGIKKASTFTIGIVLVIITLAVILNLVNSRAGRAITSIRDNEIAARSVGIPITKYKLMAFVTSAVFAGMAGVLYSLNYSSLVAKKFDYNTSILILVFVVLGGIGNLRGSVIAATVLTVRVAAQHERLPHADLRHRADRCDDLQPEPADDRNAQAPDCPFPQGRGRQGTQEEQEGGGLTWHCWK
jgi:branched-chain amino acid transport system permease protein